MPKRRSRALRTPPARPDETAGVRFLDRPVARAGAVVGLGVAILSGVAMWPETWWPRSVPALAVAVVGEPEQQWAYTSDVDPTTLTGAPQSDGGLGCQNDELHAWMRSRGGVPLDGTVTRVVLTPLRTGATVVVTGVRPVVTPLDGVRTTVLVACPELMNTGGGDLYARTVVLSLSEHPSVTYYGDEPNVATPTISLYLTAGEAAELSIEARMADGVQPGAAYAWHVEMDLLVDGRPQSVRIPEEGTFRVATVPEGPTYWTEALVPQVCRPGSSSTDWCYLG